MRTITLTKEYDPARLDLLRDELDAVMHSLAAGNEWGDDFSTEEVKS